MYFPLNIHIELVFGCNNKCKFCFEQVLNKSNYDFMSMETVNNIIDKINSNANIIKFSLRGEPLLHPNLINIIELFKNKCSDTILVIYTNGKILSENLCYDLFKAGINYIIIDCYNDTYAKYKNKYSDFNIIDFFSDKFNIYENGSINDNSIILINDIEIHSNNYKKLFNHAGNIDFELNNMKPLKNSLKSICLRPFRDMTIFYNGDVGLCCDDANIDVFLGNINTNSMMEIWDNDIINNIRRNMLNNKRNNMPCCNCDFKECFD